MAEPIQPLSPDVPRRQFTVRDIARMVEAGIFGESEHVELLDGELIVTPPQGPEHASVSDLLGDLLRAAYREDFRVRRSLPLDLGETTHPEPDVAVVRGAVATFRSRHPKGDETLLVVEVSQSTHKLDHQKAARYAQAGVPVYWIVDVPARCVEVYTDPLPSEARYVTQRTLSASHTLTAPGIDAAWSVEQLFAGL